MTTLTLTRPDDWHLHFRDGDALAALVPATARWATRAIVMPNLSPPVTTTQQAIAYRERILGHRPAGSGFEPLMILYLTDTTHPEEIDAAKASGVVFGVKLYPAGATTNSDSGVTDLRRCDDVLARMAEVGLPLLVHGEVTRSDVDIFDREQVFLEETLGPLVERFPNLRIVLEHITTKEAAAFVRSAPARVGATITPQHLLVNRNAMLVGGIRPHYYCLPILKREEDRVALVEAATSGSPKFFLGTDSAPHARLTKETDCGCAGCYSAPYALELYAQAFDDAGALDKLEGFASHHGADFYGLPRNEDEVRLVRREQRIEEAFEMGDEVVVPLWAGQVLRFSLEVD
ncbi:MAG: dihydroorotase [Candidatus Binatia bacterium]|nr:dihydroorotase [Candidatus Binatia bacterium]MDG2010777.1 dihydroorotase [Candidatus Binatia bacterium]